MNIIKPALVSLLLLSVGGSAIALGINDSKPVKSATSTTAFNKTAIQNKLSQNLGLTAESIKPSELAGLAEVLTEQGLFYVSFDGDYILQGKLYGLANNNVVNHTEESLAKVRVEGIKKFEKNMIVYPAKNEKHVVTVFTDITCGYCRKLHEQMDAYNELGITIKYLAYPREGIRNNRTGEYTQGFKDLRSVWCHENPEEALTKAKSGGSVANRICESPIAEEFTFGRQIGVSGTPAIIFDNGMMLPGYRPPHDLAQILNNI